MPQKVMPITESRSSVELMLRVAGGKKDCGPFAAGVQTGAQVGEYG
jgi:hypothetical protein